MAAGEREDLLGDGEKKTVVVKISLVRPVCWLRGELVSVTD